MGTYKKDLATTTINENIDDSQTEINVADGSLFPDTPFHATIMPASGLSNRNNSEIVLVTDVSGNAITVERGQMETTAMSFSLGSIISHAIYAGEAVFIGEGTPGTPSPWIEAGDIKGRAVTGNKIEVINNLEVSGDSPLDWKAALGDADRGVYSLYYNQKDKFPTQPSRYGFLTTYIYANNVYQEWITHDSTKFKYHRMGNNNGWFSGGWEKEATEKTVSQSDFMELTDSDNYSVNYFQMKKIGDYVLGSFTLHKNSNFGTGQLTVATIKSGYRPTAAINQFCVTDSSEWGVTMTPAYFYVTAAGNMIIKAGSGDTQSWARIMVSWRTS